MPGTDVLYTDVKFTKTRGKATDAPSPADDTTYSEVKTVNIQPPTENSGSQQQTNGRSKVTAERVALVVLSVLLIATVSVFILTYFKSGMENKELSAQQQNTTHVSPDKPSPVCDDAWEHYGKKQYYFSTVKLSWNSSRMFCIEIRADLVKIESKEEQDFLLNKVKERMSDKEDKFWIGLTDAKTEGKWLWVDNTPLNDSLKFWLGTEPDNWKGEDKNGEDCVRMGEMTRNTEVNAWVDKSCLIPQRVICAKEAQGRQ